MPPEKTAMSILGNLFVSEGKPGPVLEVKCKKRTGEDNFISCIRKALEQAYPGVSTGRPIWSDSWLELTLIWLFHPLPGSAWAAGDLAELARQVDK